MSSRINARTYTGAPELGGTVPGGRTSLLDILTGNTPTKLQEQQGRIMQQIQEQAHRHEMEEAELAARIAKDKDFRDKALQYLPPGAIGPDGQPNQKVVDEFLNNTALQMVKNQSQAAKNEGAVLDPSQNPDIINQTRIGAGLKASGVGDISKLQQTAGIGQMNVMPSIAGLNAPSTTPPGPSIVSGGINTPSLFTKKAFPGPNGEPIPFEQDVMNKVSPGSIQQPGIPIDQKVRQQILQNSAPSTTPDATDVGKDYFGNGTMSNPAYNPSVPPPSFTPSPNMGFQSALGSNPVVPPSGQAQPSLYGGSNPNGISMQDLLQYLQMTLGQTSGQSAGQ